MTAPDAWTVGRLAAALGATVVGNPDTPVTGVAMADHVPPGALTYATSAKYLAELERTDAAAVIVGHDLATSTKPLLQADVPKAAFARAMELFHPPKAYPTGVHETAVVHPSATVDASCHLGPHVVVGAEARVGPDCVLHAGVHVGDAAVLGAGCELFDHVVLYDGVSLGERVRIHAGSVIGADGFGYVFDGRGHRKVPQIGTVEIGDDVEIGAGVCVDRGTMGATRIGSGVRIDNLVQIAHNVQVGDHAIVVSQVGIAGSSTVGAYAVLAGQAGVSDHVDIGQGAIVGGQAAVFKDVPAGARVWGCPARPEKTIGRQLGALARLPDALRRLRRLEAAVAELRDALTTER